MGVLYRRCAGRKDYTGDRNHFASLSLLNDPDKLAGMIEGDLGPVYKLNANEVADAEAYECGKCCREGSSRMELCQLRRP
jgi:hypothetical protein